MTATATDLPLSTRGVTAPPARRAARSQRPTVQTAPGLGAASLTSAIRWDRVVGVLALIGTLVLIVLSMTPTDSTVLSPVGTETAPATSILGPEVATGAGTSEVGQ